MFVSTIWGSKDDMLPLMLCAGVGRELVNWGEVMGFRGRSEGPKEDWEGLSGVCG